MTGRSPDHPRHRPESAPGPGTPRWVKLGGAVLLLVLALLVVLAVFGGPGGHGPGRHASAAPAPTAAVVPLGAQGSGRPA